MIQWLARERLINMGVQQNTKVAVDSDYLIELMGYEHRTLGVLLALLEKAGHSAMVDSDYLIELMGYEHRTFRGSTSIVGEGWA
jgi:hypothetical protein